MEPANRHFRKNATRTDAIVGVVTGLIVIAVTAWLVILLF